MNKQQWKAQYQAARTLLNARHSRDYGSEGAEIVWDIAYQHVTRKMHRSIAYAAFGVNNTVYPVNTARWACKHNSRCFNRKSPFKSVRMDSYGSFKINEYLRNKVFFWRGES